MEDNLQWLKIKSNAPNDLWMFIEFFRMFVFKMKVTA